MIHAHVVPVKNTSIVAVNKENTLQIQKMVLKS